MKQKCILYILLIAILTGTISCGTTSQEETDTAITETVETETETEAKPPLPEVTFDGYEFKFLNGNTSYAHNSLVPLEDTADTIDSAFFNRNLTTAERYDITFSEVISTSPQADYSKSVLTGDNSFDVGTLRMEWAFPCVVENQAVSWDKIPHLDLTKDYWVQNSLKAFSLMNNVYFAVSAFDITHFDSVRAFCFNKNLIEEYQMTSPYDLVKDGKWTLDTYYDMCMVFASDANGDGKWGKDDLYGTYGNSNVYINTLMCGIDCILSIGKDGDDMPYFDLDNEYHMERILRVADMMQARKNGLVGGDFASGTALFFTELICSVSGLREMDDDFGIIPAPKYDESQKEYINLGGSPFFMIVPTTSPDLARTGAIMEGLAYDSVGVVDVAYYEKLLKGKTSRDEASAEMLDLIFSTLQYYHPLANGHLNSPMADKYIWNSSTEIASYFASIKAQINAEIDDALTLYKTNMGMGAE